MSKLKIFLVDDEPIDIRHFKRLLEGENNVYEVVGDAENGEKALKKIELLKPDIVFADIQMPIMDGLELAEQIKVRHLPIKVILLTAYKDFSYAQRGINAGVYAYLVKHDATKEKLQEMIKQVYNDIFLETEHIWKRI